MSGEITRDSRHSPYGRDRNGRGAEPEWRGDGREATGNRQTATVIDHLLSIETPNMKLLRLNAQIIKRQNEEMGK